jgi:cation:H+ antiporter
MDIFVNIVFLLVSIVVVLWGADKFTDGAASMARRWNVSEMIIGLTVVAMGTSMPEFVVSFFSALKGSGDMSVGNVVGSNIFNSLVIVGVSTLFMSMTLTKKLLTRDVLFVVFSSLILVALSIDGSINLLDAVVLLTCFGMYMVYSFNSAKNEAKEEDSTNVVTYGWGKTLLFLILGIGCLIGGGQLLTTSASALATRCGISERVIGLTILAAGTSLPELATSVVAARKGSNGLALGNVIGSSLFNIFLILGACAAITPLEIKGIGNIDFLTLVLSSVLLFVFGGTDRRITKVEGLVMVTIYIVYITALVLGWSF